LEAASDGKERGDGKHCRLSRAWVRFFGLSCVFNNFASFVLGLFWVRFGSRSFISNEIGSFVLQKKNAFFVHLFGKLFNLNWLVNNFMRPSICGLSGLFPHVIDRKWFNSMPRKFAASAGSVNHTTLAFMASVPFPASPLAASVVRQAP
jgi:hypothetical protein